MVDAGAGRASSGVAAGATAQAPEPESASVLDEPVLLAPGSFEGLRRALAELTPEQLLDGGQGGQRARPRRRRVPGRHQVGVRGQGEATPTA